MDGYWVRGFMHPGPAQSLMTPHHKKVAQGRPFPLPSDMANFDTRSQYISYRAPGIRSNGFGGHSCRITLMLRSLGTICILAIVPLLAPRPYLADAHVRIGLGPFPDSPITEYLVRSVCSLCVFYGGLLLVISIDVPRFIPVIRYQALAILTFSAFGVLAGVTSGMPVWFVLADAVGCWAFLLPMLFLAGRAR